MSDRRVCSTGVRHDERAQCGALAAQAPGAKVVAALDDLGDNIPRLAIEDETVARPRLPGQTHHPETPARRQRPPTPRRHRRRPNLTDDPQTFFVAG